jgi:hypothetical protein
MTTAQDSNRVRVLMAMIGRTVIILHATVTLMTALTTMAMIANTAQTMTLL